ncbi:uncharacterized protein LOC130054725 [Ostrea edulis]|uniref:uncharacterized protein LOC130054725 n=1 Tax=Ostrea edulis TaxID=37623 RepID=UPI0024AEFDBE|nr:uncharacterized protein LOC130054725 [Ostrea edulis]
MTSIKDFSYVLLFNCAMAIVQALGTAIVTVPLEDSVWGPKTHHERPRSPCNRRCDYGYDTDIEGNFICKCNDPCQNVYCFGGSSCIISKSCSRGTCRLDASCKDPRPQKDTSSTSSPKSQGYGDATYDTANFVRTNAVTICSQPLSNDIFNCPKRTRRYMYDTGKGRCVRFWGCRKPGNNFDKRRTCKETCITPYKGKIKRHRLRPRNEQCSLPVENMIVVCSGKLRRRWVYDVMKNKCVKIKGCPRHGNNFKKRLECKFKCVRRRKWRKLS